MPTGLYNKVVYSKSDPDKLAKEFPPPAGFYKVTVVKGVTPVVLDPPLTHAKVGANGVSYYAYSSADNKFNDTTALTKDDLTDYTEAGWSITFDEEDLPKQLGGTSTDYLPPEKGGTGKKTGDDKDKKKTSGETSPLLIAALAVGAIYLLTSKKGA